MKTAKKKPAHVARVGRTTIPIYAVKRQGDAARVYYQFRYYVAGVPKVLSRGDLEEAVALAEEKATGIENGRVQAGDLSAADVQSFYHAKEALQDLRKTAPPLHVILEEYVAASNLLPDGVGLVDAVRQLLHVRPQAAPSRPVGEIIEAFLLSLTDSRASLRYFRAIRNDLRAWAATLPAGSTLDKVDAESIRGYLRGLKKRDGQIVGPRRRDNVRDAIVTLFRFARSNRDLPEDRQTEAERIKRIKAVHEISYFTPEQLCTFLVHVDPHWLPWMVLGAFGGLRSSEIIGEPKDPHHERLKWTDIRWESNCIIVPKTVAKKIKRPRRVPLRDNLKAWLLPYRNARGHVYPEVKKQTLETLRLEALTGLDWVNNGLRHSYATHRMAEVGNAGQVAEEMGTSIGRIKANYDAVPADIDPKIYFGIMPGAGAKIYDLEGNAL